MLLLSVILITYITIDKVKIDVLNVSLAGDHLYVKLLFPWLSLVMSLMLSLMLSPFPLRCFR